MGYSEFHAKPEEQPLWSPYRERARRDIERFGLVRTRVCAR
jgi:hypothetical protein